MNVVLHALCNTFMHLRRTSSHPLSCNKQSHRKKYYPDQTARDLDLSICEDTCLPSTPRWSRTSQRRPRGGSEACLPPQRSKILGVDYRQATSETHYGSLLVVHPKFYPEF